jgi:glutamate dehydrogenase
VANALDVDETLIDTVCSRLRQHLSGDDAMRAEAFARQYYRWVSSEDIAERRDLDLYGAALAHFDLARRRAPGVTKVRIYNPEFEVHGWESPHTAVEVVTDDMPFLIDSIGMALNRHGFGVHLIIHPVIQVRRDGEGNLLEVLPHGAEADGTLAESVIHAEVARQTDPAELEQLEGQIKRVIDEVRATVTDWPEMRARALDVVAELGTDPPRLDGDEIAETREFLVWLEDHNFVFLGYRDYELTGEGAELSLQSVPDSGLGILRHAEGEETARGFDSLPPAVRSHALEPYLLNLTKANTRATVHRPSFLDYVGIKRFDDAGGVIGERRFLGLFTHNAYHASPREIPILRRKVDAVLGRAAFPSGSHDEKALVEILETYPRDELFQISVDDLFRISIGILHLGARQRLRLFVRRDTFDRFLSCLVFVPRDRFNTENRRRIEGILRRATGATGIDYTTRVSESVLVRLHYLAYVEPGTLGEFDEHHAETLLVAATRSWGDDLEEALIDEHGEERGAALYRRYGDAFPPAYRADWVPRSALADIARIEELDQPDDLSLRLYRPLEAPHGALRAKVFRVGPPLALSDLLPLFEDMGVEVADERPYAISPRDRDSIWIYDFGLTYSGEIELEADRLRDAFQGAFIRAWRGDTESDGYNRLVLRAGLTWREATVLRAIGRYLRQAGTTFSDRYVELALVGHPRVARLLVDLVLARFDPEAADPARAEQLADTISEEIDAVESLDQDRILRSFLDVVRATLRTNFFQRASDGTRKPYLSFKLDPAQLAWLPLPRPRFEIFVYSPRTEGVHLRGGKVARGGIRWSDRREDFRTEVLGLMKAQMVKNAVIVPVGAKGGFVLKRPPEGDDRDALLAEVEACYRTFISGMLDLTDNIEGNKIEPPPDVVRYDEDDPYLVVAADKGTATLSDVANAVAGQYGFWLGDAFASGGSSGYDHKKMGITARGAWESVKRHFRELGHDVKEQDFTVVGVGDMSGDVFGNGMLLSKHIRLIGAFDHRNVFLDPEPDAARSWQERDRLFKLARSSWDDYDRKLISEGGGVYSRAAKSIPLSPQVRAALDVRGEALAPNELIQAMLAAPVDLFWNGGIGTYVKASSETHADAGDKANDGVRIDASDLHCRVIGEGGNLGLTQCARVEYALRGGRINNDAIDNSGGVDCSDREVNIKILLDQVVVDGDLTRKQRDELLVAMTGTVGELVLKDNREQTETLSLAETHAAGMVDVHMRFLDALEQSRKLDRELEALPTNEQLAERNREDSGMTRPELAVALAYSKIDLYAELLDSDLPEDPHLSGELERYFPAPLPQRYADQIRDHRLRREIIATQVINNMEHGGGITFAFRLHEESGAPASEIARAYAAARDTFAMRTQWAEIEALDTKVAAEVQVRMLLEGRRLVERGSRWLLAHRARPLDIGTTVHFFSPGASVLQDALMRLLGPSDLEPLMVQADELEQAGVPPGLAQRVAGLATMFSTFDVVEVAAEAELDVEQVAAVHFRLGERLELHWLRDRIVALPRDDRWRALARAALRDDLYALHRNLTAEVLRRPDRNVDAWIDSNPATERCLQTLAEIRVGHVFDTTTLPVAVREVRNMLLAGSRS